MKNKKKNIFIILISIVLIGVITYAIIGNPVVFINNEKLQNSIKSIESERVSLKDITPFKWDKLYTFAPYTSKGEVEEIIGFKSSDIKENNISEGMVHLLFVREDKVVASVLGYSDNLGYNIDFTSDKDLKVTYLENPEFTVEKTGDITLLTYIE